MTGSPEKANARRQPSGRTNELTNKSRLEAGVCDVNATYGPSELCGWRVEPGVFWIQTTEPAFSRKLEKRQDVRRVEVTGVNHFRRTFEIRGTWRKVKRVIDRYLLSTGDQFLGPIRPQRAPEARQRVTIAGAVK